MRSSLHPTSARVADTGRAEEDIPPVEYRDTVRGAARVYPKATLKFELKGAATDLSAVPVADCCYSPKVHRKRYVTNPSELKNAARRVSSSLMS